MTGADALTIWGQSVELDVWMAADEDGQSVVLALEGQPAKSFSFDDQGDDAHGLIDHAGNVVPDGMNQVLMDPATRSPQPGVLTTHQYANALRDLGTRGTSVAAGIVTAPRDISEATQYVQDRPR